MKTLLYLLITLALLSALDPAVQVARAHGGGLYPDPGAGRVPPDKRKKDDPAPPPETSPGASPPGPAAPVGPVGPGPGNGPTTPVGRTASPGRISFKNWLFWWSYNREEILHLKRREKALERRVSTESSSHFFGDADTRKGSASKTPTETMVQQLVVPALEQVVADRNVHTDIRAGALIALARCGGEQTREKSFFASARPAGGDDRIVQESAILALGIMQQKRPEIRDFLIALADDVEVPTRARCFAMVSLGLLREKSAETFACLTRRLREPEATVDLSVCALLSISLIGDRERVPMLIEWPKCGRVGDTRLKEAVAVLHAPIRHLPEVLVVGIAEGLEKHLVAVGTAAFLRRGRSLAADAGGVAHLTIAEQARFEFDPVAPLVKEVVGVEG